MHAAQLEHPHEPLVGPPGPGFAVQLRRTDIWTTAIGIEIPVNELSIEHAWNILGYLRWYAPQVRASAGDDGTDAIDLVAWLTYQPMWGAIACHLVQRGEITAPWEAYEHLAVMGRMVWEEAGD
jgi:hypothetical protein